MTATVCLRERPIIFSGNMVRALLDGQKTRTRRVVKSQPAPNTGTVEWNAAAEAFVPWAPSLGNGFRRNGPMLICPYGQPGGRLWVRETWRTDRAWDKDAPATMPRRNVPPGTVGAPISYDADGIARIGSFDANGFTPGKARPSIHMPRWASRMTLELTDVRVERVQDISEADALAEGVRQLSKDAGRTWKFGIGEPGDRGAWAWSRFLPTARLAFSSLWDELNEARGHGWDANPWVWVLEFQRVAS